MKTDIKLHKVLFVVNTIERAMQDIADKDSTGVYMMNGTIWSDLSLAKAYLTVNLLPEQDIEVEVTK